MNGALPRDIAEQVDIIADYARTEELDFYPTLFEMLNSAALLYIITHI